MRSLVRCSVEITRKLIGRSLGCYTKFVRIFYEKGTEPINFDLAAAKTTIGRLSATGGTLA